MEHATATRFRMLSHMYTVNSCSCKVYVVSVIGRRRGRSGRIPSLSASKSAIRGENLRPTARRSTECLSEPRGPVRRARLPRAPDLGPLLQGRRNRIASGVGAVHHSTPLHPTRPDSTRRLRVLLRSVHVHGHGSRVGIRVPPLPSGASVDGTNAVPGARAVRIRPFSDWRSVSPDPSLGRLGKARGRSEARPAREAGGGS